MGVAVKKDKFVAGLDLLQSFLPQLLLRIYSNVEKGTPAEHIVLESGQALQYVIDELNKILGGKKDGEEEDE